MVGIVTACGDDDDMRPSVDAPTTYEFTRDGASTVSFSGQTARIGMAEELISTMKDFGASEELMLEMYRNETASGGDANPYSDASLNESTKSVRGKVAASRDYFSTNATVSTEIKNEFETWIGKQVNEVFPNENTAAAPGQPGQIADGSSTRYVNGQGLEYNQMVNKGLIGALMLDQALNNYLSVAVLDEASNRADNEDGVVAEGKSYTTMEHKWDEAYGYVYGTSADPADPNPTIGNDDSFLNKYIGRVEGDPDFAGIADDIYNAFKLGRAAIVEGDYDLRDEQAAIIREKLSTVIGVRAVYYLVQGANGLAATPQEFGPAFHDLSEGYGFIYSLQFTQNPSTGQPYISRSDVQSFIDQMLAGENGLWTATPATLNSIAASIADAFDFTVEEAGSTD